MSESFQRQEEEDPHVGRAHHRDPVPRGCAEEVEGGGECGKEKPTDCDSVVALRRGRYEVSRKNRTDTVTATATANAEFPQCSSGEQPMDQLLQFAQWHEEGKGGGKTSAVTLRREWVVEEADGAGRCLPPPRQERDDGSSARDGGGGETEG